MIITLPSQSRGLYSTSCLPLLLLLLLCPPSPCNLLLALSYSILYNGWMDGWMDGWMGG